MAYVVVSCTEDTAVRCNSNTAHRHILFWNKLMRAVIFSKIPYSDGSRTITANNLALIWMYNNIIYRTPMIITPLNASLSRLPNLNRPIFTARDHPFALAVKSDASDVVGVAFEGEDWIRVCGFYIVELDVGVGGSGEKTLVRADAETVDLTVRVLDCAGADTGEGFPESLLPKS